MNLEVFVNGECVGGYLYGYLFYFCDIIFYLYFGQENIVVVCVDNF